MKSFFFLVRNTTDGLKRFIGTDAVSDKPGDAQKLASIGTLSVNFSKFLVIFLKTAVRW